MNRLMHYALLNWNWRDNTFLFYLIVGFNLYGLEIEFRQMTIVPKIRADDDRAWAGPIEEPK